MVVFGGMASVFGSIIGAAVLTVLPQVLTFLHDYEHLVFGLVLMLTVIFLPRGLLPTLHQALRRRRPPTPRAPPSGAAESVAAPEAAPDVAEESR